MLHLHSNYPSFCFQFGRSKENAIDVCLRAQSPPPPPPTTTTIGGGNILDGKNILKPTSTTTTKKTKKQGYFIKQKILLKNFRSEIF